MKRLLSITNTAPSNTMLVLRLGLSVVMFAHGAQKMLGIWGGHGIQETQVLWEKWFHIPPILTLLFICMEFFSAVGLFLGLFTRICSIAVLLIMFSAVYFAHADHFYMNWYMEPSRSEGFEFHILISTMAIALLMEGGGNRSLDQILYQRYKAKP